MFENQVTGRTKITLYTGNAFAASGAGKSRFWVICLYYETSYDEEDGRIYGAQRCFSIKILIKINIFLIGVTANGETREIEPLQRAGHHLMYPMTTGKSTLKAPKKSNYMTTILNALFEAASMLLCKIDGRTTHQIVFEVFSLPNPSYRMDAH